MKKFLLPILALCLIIGAASFVWASVQGTPHDLAPEPCAMCHTPHSGSGQYPLWNRSQTTPGYVMYTSPSFDMEPNPPLTGPRVPSSLCLVCHNGVASELVNYPGPCSDPNGVYDLQISGCADLSNNLKDDHPLSFNYNATADADNDGFVAAVAMSPGSSRASLPNLGGSATYPLYGDTTDNNWFECTTCHSVHDTVTYDGKGDYQVFFLRADNTGSAMCLDCHRNR